MDLKSTNSIIQEKQKHLKNVVFLKNSHFSWLSEFKGNSNKQYIGYFTILVDLSSDVVFLIMETEKLMTNFRCWIIFLNTKNKVCFFLLDLSNAISSYPILIGCYFEGWNSFHLEIGKAIGQNNKIIHEKANLKHWNIKMLQSFKNMNF